MKYPSRNTQLGTKRLGLAIAREVRLCTIWVLHFPFTFRF